MPLTSTLLAGDPRIQEAYRNRNRPIAIGEPQSISVARIQLGLSQLGNPMPKSITSAGADGIFGEETLATVKRFQKDKGLRVDGMVGQHTLDALDAGLNRRPGPPPLPVPPPPPGPDHDTVITSAFQRSRLAVHRALIRLVQLREDINRADRLDGNAKIVAISTLGRVFARDIAVVSLRLMVSSDPLSKDFRGALANAIELVGKNLHASSRVKDEGVTGRCDPKSFNPPLKGAPFAGTNATAPDPRVSVCTPFFTPNPAFDTLADLQRDVITHEFFHLVGLADVKGLSNTTDALRNANTLAQIVAWLVDRRRQRNSDGNEPAIPPVPAP